MKSGFTRILRLFSGALLVALQPAAAKPLSTEECTSLVAEHAALAKKDLERMMEADPAQAKQQLKPEQLADIERFLQVEGEIRFRCPEVQLAIPEIPPLEPEEEEMKAATDTQPAGPFVPMPDRNPKRVESGS